MRIAHLPLLVCPKSLRPLELEISARGEGDRVRDGRLLEPRSGISYPIRNFIPRFVGETNYANSFGFQWNKHSDTQRDDYAGVSESTTRFFAESRWPRQMPQEILLEVGCGAGRFTAPAISTGATVISLDYSTAVDANYSKHGSKDNLLLVQASVYEMPIKRSSADKAFCFGVLQHTPDPKKSFLSIVDCIKSGGAIATDIYLKSWKSYLHVKPYVRPFVRNMPPERLYPLTVRYVDFVWSLTRALRRTAWGRTLVGRFIAERSEFLLSASDDLRREWSYLDTFDWFSPAYDFPQTLSEFRRWHHEAPLTNIEVQYGYNGVEARAIKA